MMIRRTPPRRGSTLVESALVYPVLFLVLFAIVSLGVGVFRKQQVTHIAREAARWASVHGEDYAMASKNPAADEAAVYTNAILPQAGTLQASKLTYSVTWPDGSKKPVRDVNTGTYVVAKGSRVTVTVNYVWDVVPFFGPMTLTSTSTATINF